MTSRRLLESRLWGRVWGKERDIESLKREHKEYYGNTAKQKSVMPDTMYFL